MLEIVNQLIEKTKINDSFVLQQAINLSSTLEENTLESVYFIFGDSEYQILCNYIKSNDDILDCHEYYIELRTAFILLLLFKPISYEIVIDPSSIVQSINTSRIYQEFAPFSNFFRICIVFHDYDIKNYIGKKIDIINNLLCFKKFERYTNPEVIKILNNIPSSTIRKSFSFCGKSDYIAKTENLLLENSNVQNRSILHGLVEINYFVWENIYEYLSKNDFAFSNNDLPFWMRKQLFNSWYLSICSDYLIPYNLFFSHHWSSEYKTAKKFYLDIQFLKMLVQKDINDICSLSAKQLMYITTDKYFLEFKSVIFQLSNTSVDDGAALLLVAAKNNNLLHKAILKAKRQTS